MTRFAIVVLVIGGSVAHAQVASTAFNQAAELEKQGKWTEACPLYETSYKADPQIGVLLYLAQCHEHIGRIASAWAEYNDAADLAHGRNDPRESTARDHAKALAPRLAKLFVSPPSKPIAGLVLKRDGVDITALIGANVPIDPGEHLLVASAPGYVDWTKKVTIADGSATAIDLPLLDKTPAATIKTHDGTLEITTQADAEILIDTQRVGVGHYEAKVRSGGHTLRVVAPGRHPYQSEIVVGDDEARVIDVPLELEGAPVAPPESLPTFELGASFAPGAKEHGDHPAVISYRIELALRLGRRVNFGVFTELASVSASGSCGTDIVAGMPSTQFDFEARMRFNSCRYFMAGAQLYIHIRPKQRIDPYVGIDPGFRFGLVDYSTYDASGMTTGPTQTLFLPGIAVGTRVGVDVHPRPDVPGWEVGAYFDTQFMVIGQENFNDASNSKGQSYISLFGGLRTTYQF